MFIFLCFLQLIVITSGIYINNLDASISLQRLINRFLYIQSCKQVWWEYLIICFVKKKIVSRHVVLAQPVEWPAIFLVFHVYWCQLTKSNLPYHLVHRPCLTILTFRSTASTWTSLTVWPKSRWTTRWRGSVQSLDNNSMWAVSSVGVERSRGLKGGWILAWGIGFHYSNLAGYLSQDIHKIGSMDLSVECGLSWGNKQDCLREGHHPWLLAFKVEVEWCAVRDMRATAVGSIIMATTPRPPWRKADDVNRRIWKRNNCYSFMMLIKLYRQYDFLLSSPLVPSSMVRFGNVGRRFDRIWWFLLRLGDLLGSDWETLRYILWGCVIHSRVIRIRLWNIKRGYEKFDLVR